MTLHVSHLHLPHPSRTQVRLLGRFAVAGATVPVVVLAASAGLTWPLLVVFAALAGVKVGHLRGSHVQRIRHIKAEEGHQEVIHQQRLQLARFEDEQRFWWNAGRDRHINDPYARSGAPLNERSRP